MITSRVCTKCNIEKPLDDFGNYKGGKYGKRERCKDCIRVYNREYVRNHLDKHKENNIKWRKKNRDYDRIYRIRKYLTDPEYYKKKYAKAQEKKVKELIDKNIKYLTQLTKEKADFIESIVKWPDDQRAAFMFAKRIFEEDLKDDSKC